MSLLPVYEACPECGNPKAVSLGCMWCMMLRSKEVPPIPVTLSGSFSGEVVEPCRRWMWGQDRRHREKMLPSLIRLVTGLIGPWRDKSKALTTERDAARKQAEKFDAALNSVIARRVTPAEKAVLDFVYECNSYNVDEFQHRVAVYRKERS